LDLEVVEIGYADRPALVVGRSSVLAATDEAGPSGRRWVIDVHEPAGSYAVQAHWALASEEPNGVGNYRTMEHIGVSDAAWRGEDVITVPLRRIG